MTTVKFWSTNTHSHTFFKFLLAHHFFVFSPFYTILGARLDPLPTFPYDIGGSYGSCTTNEEGLTTSSSSNCLINSKVLMFTYDANRNTAQDQDLDSAFPCQVTSWNHNMVQCYRLFQNNAKPRGNLVVYTDWDKPNWWWRSAGSTVWMKYSSVESQTIEHSFPTPCKTTTTCKTQCLCTCSSSTTSVVLPGDSNRVVHFNQMNETNSGDGTTKNIIRMCGELFTGSLFFSSIQYC